MRRSTESSAVHGFTIIELIVVITIIVIIAMIAIPNMISARMMANETAAIQTIRSICTAQSQFRGSSKADEDLDGTGEHGSFGELSGKVGVRGGATKIPTDLSGSIRNISFSGEVERSGYVYRMYLPDANGRGVREQPGGGFPLGSLDPDNAEGFWCCYAWPIRFGVSGRKSFVISQRGDIRFTETEKYSGANCPDIRAGVSFVTTDIDSQTAEPAVNVAGADGNVWRAHN